MATETRIGRRLDATRAAMRRDAAEQMEKARRAPAPCGCAPEARCDRHCRVKIHGYGRAHGSLYWAASCNGQNGDETAERCPYAYDRMVCGVLTTLHNWATEHVAEHRAAALDRAHNHGQRST